MEPPYDEHRVSSGDLSLSVREYTAAGPGKAHVVLVHGYPDSQGVWSRLVEALGPDRFHVVTYDVRGAGDSDAPAATADYRTELLVEDLVAVVSATVPDDEPFHLVGHDWGSVQGWDIVAAEATHPRLTGRIASFTSISGPSIDHLAYLSRHRDGRELRLLRQTLHSWYVYAFQVPVLPDLACTLAGQIGGRLGLAHWGPELARNARNGLNLYRANMLPRRRRPRRWRTDVPVLVIDPTGDPFLTDVLLEDLDQICFNVTVERLDAGHWVQRSHPGQVAALVSAHVEASARA